MSGLARRLLAGVGAAENLYVDDVFSTWLYTSNGATQTITNGIDLAGKGGMVWTKRRDATGNNNISNTSQGGDNYLYANGTQGLLNAPGLYSFLSNGYSLPIAYPDTNTSNGLYASWTFRNADKFYGHKLVTKSAGSNATVSFANLGTLGMVRVKRTDAAGSWYIWHRSLSAGKLLIGETTAAAATLGHVTVSGATVTLVNGVIADGTYLVEAFAHDPSADGLIQCGSFTTNSSGNASVNLGWEPQYLMTKVITAGTADEWFIGDVLRGLVAQPGLNNLITANSVYAELSGGARPGAPTSTGFLVSAEYPSKTFIYLAIRRPNKPPTTGAEVYNAIVRMGNATALTPINAGFPTDLAIVGRRDGLEALLWADRLRGKSVYLRSDGSGTDANAVNRFDGFDYQNGFFVGYDTSTNASTKSILNYAIRRAPGFMDEILYDGTGANKTETHGLGVQPELWLAKRRNAAGNWVFGSILLAATEKIAMPSPSGKVTDATAWNSAYPTSSNISLGTLADVNASGGTYVAYLFATLAGISKVGAYPGNGGTQIIGCGFSTGARFVMIIRATAGVAQDIYIWDTARGIIAGNDPHLSLNTTAAEATTDDSIDPDAIGFIVNQNAATNINVTGASYIFLAIS